MRNSTPNYMVFGESGRFPLEIEIKLKVITLWYKLITGSKSSSMLYNLMFKFNVMGNTEFKWLAFVKSILNNTGLNYIWNHQEIFTVKKRMVKN